MENQIGAFEDGGGPYQSLPANDDIIAVASSSDDAHRLNQLGYKQELSRSLSAISNFSVTFSIISVITGLTTTFNYGLTYGGPVTMIWGWPIVGGFTLVVGLSMAEICSAYPTSGGLYFWSAKLCGNDWGPLASWLTGWFNIVGQWAVTTSIDFSLAQLIQVIILLSTGGKNGGGYEASKYVVIGIHGGILLLHAIINSLPITWLSLFGQLAALWNLVGVFVLMILIPTVAKEKASAKFVFTFFNTDNGDGINSKVYIFVLGLLMSQYTLTGYDASAHMTEETKSADKNGPKGIISAIGISVIVGWGYLLGITFAVTNIPYLLSENNDAGGYAIAEVFYLAFKNRYGNGIGGIICLGVVAVAIFFCGMSSITSNSRMVYAFSRDGAMPLSSVWHKVNKHEVPLNAVWLSAIIAFCMALKNPNSVFEETTEEGGRERELVKMSSTLLEVTRAGHEEVERLERLIVKDLQNEPASSKDRLFQNHRVRNMIDEITSTTLKLVEIYEDKDSARKDEIAALGGQTATGTNVFSAFYDRLKEIREYHRRHPAARVVDVNEEYEELLKEEPRIEFTGEEALGRYLDLHELYNEYINSKFAEPIEYSAYLDVFSQPHKIPRKLKLTRKYREYLEKLQEYLIYFFDRTEPLQDLDRIFSKVITEFEEQWAIGQIQGWENEAQENGHVSAQPAVIDLDYYSTVEELMEVGPERLKEALAALGLKTGGTIQQRAERLFLTKHTPLEQLDRKHFAKGSRVSEQNANAAAPQQAESSKEIALMEAKMKKLCDLLQETIVRTKENVEKKQALTYEEMEAEREEEEVQADTESDDDEQQIYNPLKLPMGWDGKPIPYWLYKLHGLGQEFKCEICGNHSYWGRRAYERHFKEWRHQHGMRCLGIPNTKNFNEITSIEEAKQLWERIQERQGVNKWRPDLEEEYEDKEGNIYNKKTYTDLQRQGLI